MARLDPSLSVLSPDLPGFGETPALVGKPHDLAAYGEWLRLLVTRAAGDRPVVLVGHSFGSIIAAATVADGLEINQLILINPIGAPALSGPRGILSRLAVLYYWFGARLPRVIGRPLLRSRLITRGLSMIMTKTQDRELRRWIHDQHDRYFGAYANEHVVLESFTASVSHDVSQSAGHITVPTLLIAGADDDITDLRAQRRLCKLFVEAELMELPDVGHLIHYEAPGRAASAINRLALSLVIPRS